MVVGKFWKILKLYTHDLIVSCVQFSTDKILYTLETPISLCLVLASVSVRQQSFYWYMMVAKEVLERKNKPFWY